MNYSDTKKHYKILDGLRGVAAIIVVAFHLFEMYNEGSHQKQIINHGYLAVDFFFVLSGFVIGYAYDDRWKKMSVKNFFKRRLIRLHPMIIMGMTIGAICYYFSASPILFPSISETPLWKLIGIMLIGYTLLPVPPSMDIRGWIEMHPINGPAWSLFFEYIANILYAFVLRKLPNKILGILVVLAAILTVHLTLFVNKGDVIGGWSLTPDQLGIGISRLLYPFFAGLLLSRIAKPGKIKNAFMWSSLLITAILICPRIGGDQYWMNGIYESFAIIILFPLTVYLGASGDIKGKKATKLCNFLGDISYPLYITHYPIVYIFAAWRFDNNEPLDHAYPVMILVMIITITIAYASFKWYDVKLRKILADKLLYKKDK